MPKITFDKSVEIAVENGIDIAHLKAGSMILYHLIRLEDIAAYLASPGNLALCAVELGDLSVAFLLLEDIQSRFEDLHGLSAVLVLAALILALDNEAAWLMR